MPSIATRILGIVFTLLAVGHAAVLAQEVHSDYEAVSSSQPSAGLIAFDGPTSLFAAPLMGVPAVPIAARRIRAPSPAASGTDYTLRGKVRDEQTRVPLAQAHLTVLDAQTGETLQEGIVTDAEGRYEATLTIDDTGTDVDDQPETPASYWVSTPSPHPIPAAYAQAVTLRYTAPPSAQAGHPELDLFDLQGRRLDPAQPLAAGLYVYRLRFPDGQVTNTASFVRLGSGALDVRLVRLSGEPAGARSAQQASKTSTGRLDVILVVEKTGYETLERTASLDAATETMVDLRLMPINPIQQPDEVTYDVEYASNAVVIANNGMDALVEADTAQHRFVFDASELQQANIDLHTDQVILIEGLALGRITDVQQDDGTVTIDTEEATLNEVIQNGTISWEKTVDFSAYRTAQVSLGKQSCSPAVNLDTGQITFTCQVDPYTLTFEFKPGNGVTEVKVEIKKQIGTNTSARLTGIGMVREFDAGGTASFAGGDMSSADIQYNGVRVNMTLEIAAAGSGSGDLNFELPTPAIKIPFTVGPVPMQIGIGTQAVLSLDVPLEAQASATASVDISYDGDHGLQYEGSDVDFDASVNGQDITNGDFDSASNFAPVDAQYGVAFPRISLHVLTKEVAWIHAGFTTGTRLEFNPVCKTGYGRILVDAGYGLTIFGVDLVKNKINLYDEQEQTDGCENE